MSQAIYKLGVAALFIVAVVAIPTAIAYGVYTWLAPVDFWQVIVALIVAVIVGVIIGGIALFVLLWWFSG